MSHMNAEMTDKQWWLSIDGQCGNEFIPEMLFNREAIATILAIEDVDLNAELYPLVKDYLETSDIFSAELVHGYGVRSSASGYMDCTSWSVYTNKREAERAARQEQRECEGGE